VKPDQDCVLVVDDNEDIRDLLSFQLADKALKATYGQPSFWPERASPMAVRALA